MILSAQLVASLALLAAAARAPQVAITPSAPSAPAAASTRELDVRASDGAEHFVVERTPAGAKRPEPVGLLVLHPPRGESERTLEMEIHFRDGDVRVHLTETTSAAERRLVWREYGASTLRTWVAVERAGESGLAVTSWGLGEPTRAHLATSAPIAFPLECIESLRRGGEVRSIVRAWPPSAGLETLSVERIDLASDALPPSWRARLESGELVAPRGVRLVRGDGTAAESFLFDGDALVALELQPGGSCAHRIDAERAHTLDAGMAREPGGPTRWQHLREWTELRRRAR